MQITLKGKPIHTNGQLPQKGTPAPDFILIDQELKEHSLKDYKGRRKLLSIVPSLDTQVCSTSVKKFNQAMKDHPEAVALVISADLPFAQKRMCGVENLHNIITLSMMRDKEFAKSYGVLIIDGPLAGLCARAVLVLDEQNKVLYTEFVSEVTQEPSYDRALECLLEN